MTVDDVIVESAPPELDVAAAVQMVESGAGTLQRPITVRRLDGGQSNLSLLVQGRDGRAFVLRRPPFGNVLPTAHDMAREHRVLAALADTAVPAPRVYAFYEQEPTARNCYVMDFIDGHVLEAAGDASELSPEVRRRASQELIQVLVELHRVDPDSVGLGDLGRREGYVERQLRRWGQQWEATRTHEVPRMEGVRSWLADGVPTQAGATIVHGDYRFGNCVFAPSGELLGILDWELCTLGDPMADVGYMLLHWDQEGDAAYAAEHAPTRLEGFLTREEAMAAYAQGSGRDLADVGYYIAFQAWRLACIKQGVYQRAMEGRSGMAQQDPDVLRAGVEHLVALADDVIDRVEHGRI